MKFCIAPVNPQIDYEPIAELLTVWTGNLTTAAELYEEDQFDIDGRIHHWWVARDEQHGFLGFGYAARYPSEPKGRFHGYAVVHEAYRQMGVGSALNMELQAFLELHHATDWRGQVQETDEASLEFAKRHGFEVMYHSFDSALDLTEFDDAPFQGVVEAVEAAGIRFFTFDTVSHDPQAQRKLYDINRLAGLDEPTTDSFAPFETWKKIVMDAPWFQHDCEFIAADGDRFIGLSGAFPTADPAVFENGFTGIDPAYRGRSIAKALKVLTIRQAVARNGAEIRTSNDSRNAPMLAINRKLGYRPLPGYYGLRKKLSE